MQEFPQMQPPPPPRVSSKRDSLILMPDSVKAANVEEHVASSLFPPANDGKQGRETTDKEVENEVEVENVERPVDLYKAIFSDDSDDEEENTVSNQVEDPQKKIEAANTTLNRLMAGDFLESLGKELGLAVPPEKPPSENKAGPSVAQKENLNAQKENINADTRDGDYLTAEKNQTATNVVGSSTNGETKENKKPDDPHNTQEGRHQSRTRNHSQSSSSSEDEPSRKRSRGRKHKDSRSSSSGSDTSEDSDNYQDRHRSSSRRKDKGTSREGGAATSTRSIENIEEGILPVDHIVAREKIKKIAKERKINTMNEEGNTGTG